MRIQRLTREKVKKGNEEAEIHQRNDVEEWFLRRGMPTMARSSSSPRNLLLRASPVLFGFSVAFLLVFLSDFLLEAFDPAASAADGVIPAWYLVALVASIVIGIIAGLVLNRYVRRGTLRIRHVDALTSIVPLSVVLLPTLYTITGQNFGIWLEETVANVVLMVLILVFIRIGLGAVLVWSIRQAVTQGMALTSLAARALPMILLVTLFAFFSDGVWKVTSSLDRGDLWNVVLILFLITAVFVWAVIRDEMRSMLDGAHSSVEGVLALGFPVDRIHPQPSGSGQTLGLTRRESVNALAILLIAQGIQIGFLVMLVFTFFCVFGSIALPAPVLEDWAGQSVTTGSLMGFRLPINDALIQTSLFIAAFSSVSFAASSVTDPVYRKSFFDPLLNDMTVTITARNLYHAASDAAPALVTSQSIPAAPSDARE